MRTNIGETLSFHPMKGTKLEYTTILPASPVRQSNVSVSIEEVRHYAVNNEGTMVFKTALNCSEVPVASKEDAQEVSNFMINQCGFEIDSYGVNNLES